jgi:hypothetical protein
MTVVCDATPLIHLSAMSHLDLLHRLFGEVLVPDEVYHEVVDQGAGKAGSAEVQAAAWVRRQAVTNQRALAAWHGVLGSGEGAAILLAAETGADLIVLDDRDARLHAVRLGLNVTGTVGVLLAAAKRDLVQFEQALEALTCTGFHLSARHCEAVLRLWRERSET